MLELVLQYCKQCRPFALLRCVVERMLWAQIFILEDHNLMRFDSHCRFCYSYKFLNCIFMINEMLVG